MNEILLAHTYRVFMVQEFLENDIKNIKKINTIYAKFLKTKKIIYIIEIINILTAISNVLHIEDAKEYILHYIEFDHRYKIRYVIDNLSLLDCRILRDNIDVFTI